MAAVKPRCFLATNGNTLNYLTMTSHYDTLGIFDKNLPVCHKRRRTVDSVPKVKLVLQTGQHTPKQVIKYMHRKLNTQTKQ